MPELSFVPEYGVVPSRAQFEEAVARLEWHLAQQTRIKLADVGPTELVAEYVRLRHASEAFEHFMTREVCHFMRDWWRIDPISEVDALRRRINRQRKLNIQHHSAIANAVLAAGPDGIEAIKQEFLRGEEWFCNSFCYTAIDHFPDEAEPVFVALGRDSAVRQIQGYRARRPGDFAPELQVGSDAGLAPALATEDKSPAEFPTELFACVAHHLFTGEMTLPEATDAAWRQLISELRLDPRHLETADLAAFDPRHAWKMSDPVRQAYGDRPYARKLSSYGFTYVHPDGTPVTLEELAQALYHVFRHSSEGRYAPAAAWRRC